jgi:hypothetical protein
MRLRQSARAEEGFMRARIGFFAGLVVCMASFASTADAQQGVIKGKAITVKGCVQFLPPPCKKLGGYVLNDAVPYVPTETYVVVTGKVTQHSGLCGAPRLTDITWKPAKGACAR